jgi:hypothetical protein
LYQRLQPPGHSERAGVILSLKNPHRGTSHFVGRREELVKIHTQLYQHCGAVVISAVAGMGGVGKTDESLNIARAHLEIELLENLSRSEEIAQECLQIFQEYNRLKLEASARKLLGEIYLKRRQQNQPGASSSVASQFLAQSLQIYQNLDLQEKVQEVQELINNDNTSQN